MSSLSNQVLSDCTILGDRNQAGGRKPEEAPRDRTTGELPDRTDHAAGPAVARWAEQDGPARPRTLDDSFHGNSHAFQGSRAERPRSAVSNTPSTRRPRWRPTSTLGICSDRRFLAFARKCLCCSSTLPRLGAPAAGRQALRSLTWPTTATAPRTSRCFFDSHLGAPRGPHLGGYPGAHFAALSLPGGLCLSQPPTRPPKQGTRRLLRLRA